MAQTPKGERRRQTLLKAAADLLLNDGIEAVRHRAVAERAGVPLASTTYYFTSLEDLVAHTIEHSGDAEIIRMRTYTLGVVAADRDVSSTVELILDLLVGDVEGLDGHDHLIARCERLVASARHAELRPVLRTLRSESDDVLIELMRRCGRSCSLASARRITAMVDGAVVAALIDNLPGPRAAARALLLDVVDLVAPLGQ